MSSRGSFQNFVRPSPKIDRVSRNNIIGELTYGSNPAEIRSEPAEPAGFSVYLKIRLENHQYFCKNDYVYYFWGDMVECGDDCLDK
jgi:hypothetical protein